jgi:hypothetical protein
MSAIATSIARSGIRERARRTRSKPTTRALAQEEKRIFGRNHKMSETAVVCEFALLDVEDETQGIMNATPVRRLSPSDNRSLIVRHH